MANKLFSVRLVTTQERSNQRALLVKMLNRSNGRIWFRLCQFILIVSVIIGCNSSDVNSLKKKLAKADKVKIYFFDEMTGTPFALETIDNIDTVRMILTGVSEENTPDLKCGYTGALEFFEGNQSLMNMEFNVQAGCEHIVYMLKDNSYSKKLISPTLEILSQYYKQNKIN